MTVEETVTFENRLRKNKDTIVRRWLEGVLATYPEESRAAFARQKDPFANPIGHALRVAAPALFEALFDGVDALDAEEIRRHLREIIKIRAVQEFSASAAVGFVFQLKQSIRTELGKAIEDPRVAAELVEFEGRIDRMALAAFDVFVECREQVCELRINEVKRSVSWVAEKKSKRNCCDLELTQIDSE